MKTNPILSSFLFALIILTLGCSGKKGDDSHDHEQHNASGGDVTESSAQFEVSQEFQTQLGDVFTNYNALKDAFIASDPDKVKEETSSTSQAVARVDMKLLEGQAHSEWMTYLASMDNALKQIEKSADIEEQREAFSTLSDNLYKSVKAFGLGGKEAFYDFCPMAFNNEGAYWLSDSETIRNPYFGDKMLSCGMVKEKLR
jgi:Cu(I)/Ag(I) efflux system membrane fusion protein